MEKYFTRQEVADTLKVHVLTVDRWIKNGELEVYRVGGTIRITKEQIDKFVKKK